MNKNISTLPRLMTSVLITGACSLFAVQSQAAVVEWTLDSFMFDDGGTASGSFKVDFGNGSGSLDIDDIFDINIQTTSGSAINMDLQFDSARSVVLVPGFPNAPNYAIHDIRFSPTTKAGTDLNNWLGLRFSFPLSEIETSIPIQIDAPFYEFRVSGQSTEDDTFNNLLSDNPFERGVDSGSVKGVIISNVPLPAAAWLFGSTLVALSILSRKNAV